MFSQQMIMTLDYYFIFRLFCGPKTSESNSVSPEIILNAQNHPASSSSSPGTPADSGSTAHSPLSVEFCRSAQQALFLYAEVYPTAMPFSVPMKRASVLSKNSSPL